MFSPSVIYNHAKLRSCAMCNAGESFISQRLTWATRYTFTVRNKATNVAGHIPAF